MRFAFAGDTHGNMKTMYQDALDWQAANGHEINYIFQVGDFGVWPTFEDMDPSARNWSERHKVKPKKAAGDYPGLVLGEWEVPIPTYFIRGNHEDQLLLCTHEKVNQKQYPDDYLTRAIEIHPNLHYIPDGHVVEVEGVKIASWGGCWSWKTFPMEYWGNDRHMKHTNKKYGPIPYAKRLEHMTRDRYERLMREDFDILMTHDAPTGCGVVGARDVKHIDSETLSEDQPEGTGVKFIRELIETVQPRMHFCGHWHQYHLNQIGETRSIVLDQIRPGKDPEFSLIVVEI